MNPIVIESVACLEVPVTIGGQEYVIVEANGDAACEHRNAMLDNAVFENGEVKAVKKLASLELLLLSRVLYKVETDEEGKPIRKLVPRATIEKWPGRVVTQLYKAAKEISALDEEAKNEESPSEPSGSTAG
jgi:hypothetical protein